MCRGFSILVVIGMVVMASMTITNMNADGEENIQTLPEAIRIGSTNAAECQLAREELLSMGPNGNVEAMGSASDFLREIIVMREYLIGVRDHDLNNAERCKAATSALKFFGKYRAIEFAIEGLESNLPDIRFATAETLDDIVPQVDKERQ